MIVDLLISALLVIGGLFGLNGAFGLLKLRTPMQRLHAPTKATTVGVGSALIASAATAALAGGAPWQEAMVAIFLFLTVRSRHQAQLSALVSVRKMFLFVARGDAALVGLDPDLQEMRGVIRRVVELAVLHAAAGTHALHIAGRNAFDIAHAVFVRQIT